MTLFYMLIGIMLNNMRNLICLHLKSSTSHPSFLSPYLTKKTSKLHSIPYRIMVANLFFTVKSSGLGLHNLISIPNIHQNPR